ncbi:MAG: hypothetical protein DRP84_08175 [Spirochaetes bacterium]|nr:MAG: hypothetical protein DRP84_08175 [Spirochaetota bacterium]
MDLKGIKMYFCSNCGNRLSIDGKVSRSDTCPFCHAYLRSCINCKFYSPGYHNDCREPQAELVTDKHTSNFCEYFKYREGPPTSKKGRKSENAKNAFKKLFGD